MMRACWGLPALLQLLPLNHHPPYHLLPFNSFHSRLLYYGTSFSSTISIHFIALSIHVFMFFLYLLFLCNSEVVSFFFGIPRSLLLARRSLITITWRLFTPLPSLKLHPLAPLRSLLPDVPHSPFYCSHSIRSSVHPTASNRSPLLLLLLHVFVPLSALPDFLRILSSTLPTQEKRWL